MSYINEIGNKYGKLLVKKVVTSIGADRKKLWLCACDCGNFVEVRGAYLRSGKTSSCGCLRVLGGGGAPLKHGMSYSSEYVSWSHMLQRCNNRNDPKYLRYGNRGISVCLRWNTFENFIADMGNKPSPTHSIDRINNDDGYYKENCRWATPKQQANNRSNTVVFKKGEFR
jgi:hypothetical protein